MSYFLAGASIVKAHGVILSTPTSTSLGTFAINSQVYTLSVPPPSTTSYPVVDFELLTASNLDRSVYNTLEITASGEGAFYLDYLLLDSDVAFISESVPSVCGGSVGSDDDNFGGGDNDSGGGERKHGVGAVVGGVFAALAAMGLVVWILVRRSRRKIATSPTRDHPVLVRGNASSNTGQ